MSRRRGVGLAAVVGLALTLVTLPAATTSAAPTTATDSATPPLPTPPDRLAFTATSFSYRSNGDPGWDTTLRGIGTIGFDGSDQRTLTQTTGYGYDYGPQWSPDGYWLAFTRQLDNNPANQVVIMPRDGGDQQVVDTDGVSPTWSPTGRQLAWVSVASDGSRSVVIADIEETPESVSVGTPRTLVTVDSGFYVMHPQFSPDGQTLVYGKDDLSSPDDGALFTVAADGGTPLQITHTYPAMTYRTFAWSPIGTQILFLADMDPDPHVLLPRAWLVNPDGSDEHQVTDEEPSEYDMEVAWLPDGLRIGAVDNAYAGGLRILSADTGVLLQRLAADAFDEWDGLEFSADGTLAYTVGTPKKNPESYPPNPPDLYAIPLTGAPILRLTTDHSVSGHTIQVFDPGRALRVIATNPVDQALALSRELFTSAPDVVIAMADRPLDALAASPLAAAAHVPLLLLPESGVSAAIRQELQRLGATDVYTVGPIPPAINDQLSALGLRTHAVTASSDPTSLAGAVAAHIHRPRAVVAVTDAAHAAWSTPLAAAGYAAARRLPLLYAGAGRLPAVTRAALRRNHTSHVTAVAPKSVDPKALVAKIRRLGVSVTVVRGSRFRVSAALAAMAARTAGAPRRLVLASGASWRASLASAAAAAAGGGVSLLVPARGRLDQPTRQFLRASSGSLDRAWIAGDISDVSPRVETTVERLLDP